MSNSRADVPRPYVPVRRPATPGSPARSLALALGVTILVVAGFAAAARAATDPGVPAESATPADPGPRVDSTASHGPIRITGHTRLVRVGRTVRLKGDSGIRSSSRIRVQFRAATDSRWRTRKVVRTSRTGRFRTRVRAGESGSFRVRDRSGRGSRPVEVKVRSATHLKRTAATVKLGRRLRISGSVRPRGVRRVRIRLAGAGRTVTVRAGRGGRFAWNWRPAKAGDVRIRALALGNPSALKSRSNKRHSSALRPGGASFYGPGLYGNGVACGGTLRPGTIGVAHKTLPCGTRVKFRYGHRIVSAKVIDRGPYVAGRDWDLTAALRNRLGFGGVGTVWTNR